MWVWLWGPLKRGLGAGGAVLSPSQGLPGFPPPSPTQGHPEGGREPGGGSVGWAVWVQGAWPALHLPWRLDEAVPGACHQEPSRLVPPGSGHSPDVPPAVPWMQGAFPVGRLWGHTLWRRESTRAGAAAVWTVGRRPARPAGSPRRRRIWAKLSGVLGPEAPRPVWVPPAWRGRVSAELEVVGLGCWELQRPREQRPSRSLFKLLASVGASRLKAGLYRGPGARPSFPRGSSGSLALFTGLPCSRRFLVSRKDKERGQRLCGRPCPPLAAGGQCLRWDLARRGAEGREGVPPPRPAPGSGCGSATGVGGEHRRAWSPRDPTRGAFH